MDFLFYSLGTVGDALPFLKLASSLNGRGARVVFVGNEKFAALAQSFGIEFHAVSSRREYEKTYNNPLTWSPSYNQNHYNEFHLPAIKPTFQYIEGIVHAGQKPFIVFQDAFSGARMACEEFGLAHAQVVLAPYAVASRLSPVYPLRKLVPEAAWPEILPALDEKNDKDAFERLVVPFINPVRAELGLAEWNRASLPKLERSAKVLALFPDWFKPRPADWPAQLHNTGFVLGSLDVGFDRELLDAFIEDNGAPITFSFGTGIPVTAHLVEKVARICAEARRPGVLVAHGQSVQLIDTRSPPLLVLPVARFDYLFPRSSLVVHHGGIGTCAQALAAGVPQLITPYSFDQPDNAYHLWQLGAGNSVDLLNTSVMEIADAVEGLLTSESVRDRARHCASLTRDATETSADYLLGLRH